MRSEPAGWPLPAPFRTSKACAPPLQLTAPGSLSVSPGAPP